MRSRQVWWPLRDGLGLFLGEFTYVRLLLRLGGLGSLFPPYDQGNKDIGVDPGQRPEAPSR